MSSGDRLFLENQIRQFDVMGRMLMDMRSVLVRRQRLLERTDCAALMPLKSLRSKRRISDTIDVFSWRAELLGIIFIINKCRPIAHSKTSFFRRQIIIQSILFDRCRHVIYEFFKI